MANINKVFITGNVTREPELRTTKGGFSVLAFTVAVNDRRKEGDEWVDVPNFIDVVTLGNRAESLAKYLHKGMKVAVEGKLHQSSWEQEGKKRSKIEVTANEVEIMSGGKKATEQKEPEISQGDLSLVYDTDDIPF